jgi:hypothetical protein
MDERCDENTIKILVEYFSLLAEIERSNDD